MLYNEHSINRAHEVRINSDNRKSLKVRIADLNIKVNCIYGNSFYEFKKYLTAFEQPDIILDISHDDIDRERLSHPELSIPDIVVDNEKVGVTYNYGCLEPFVALHKFADAILSFNSFLMHGAVIAIDENAYMFTASSGVGKTTRTLLWMDEYPESIVVNGDKPVIRIDEGSVFACGTPWSGKERLNTNTMVPLRAIFLLERSDKDTIEEVNFGKAFPFLLKQTHRPAEAEAMRKTIELLKALNGKVKVYKFCSTPTVESIRLAYETAKF